MSQWTTSAGLLLVLFGVVIFLIWIALRAWRRVGETKTEAVAAKRAADQARRAKEIDEDVRNMSDDDLDKRL